MPATRYSPQEAFNLSNGTAPTALSLQEIANISDGSAYPTEYTFQEVLNLNLGVHGTMYSEQEALFRTLQEMLNMAYDGEVTVEETLDDAPPTSALLMESGDALLAENGNTLIMEG
jgi:hypothetical protein